MKWLRKLRWLSAQPSQPENSYVFVRKRYQGYCASAMKKIFISRNISYDSIFYEKLTAKGFDVHGESLVDFAPIPIDQMPDADWLFFYSQNGVRFLLDQVAQEEMAGMKLAAIGPATASVLQAHHLQADFVGDGDPESTAAAFLQTAKGCTVLFPRAKESRQSIQQLLENDLTALDLVVYENKSRTNFELPDFDILVFTSPMNAQAFFAKKSWQPSLTIIAIGKTTAAALTALGIGKVLVADYPSEEMLAEAVLSVAEEK